MVIFEQSVFGWYRDQNYFISISENKWTYLNSKTNT